MTIDNYSEVLSMVEREELGKAHLISCLCAIAFGGPKKYLFPKC